MSEINFKRRYFLFEYLFNRNEDLKKAVEQAIGQIVNPVKVKEQLVNQLKTQIADLERFINFLQGEANSPGPYGKTQCTCPVHDSSFIFPVSLNSLLPCFSNYLFFIN